MTGRMSDPRKDWKNEADRAGTLYIDVLLIGLLLGCRGVVLFTAVSWGWEGWMCAAR